MSAYVISAKKTERYVQRALNAGRDGNFQLRKFLLASGILSSVFYVVINMIVPAYDPDYSMVTQTVSELSAVGARTRHLWVVLASFYSPLVIAFGLGIWLSSARNRPLRICSLFMILFGLSGFFWPPMHQREVIATSGNSLTDVMHIVFAIVTVLLMMVMMGFGAAALDRHFRFFTLIIFLLFLVFGFLTGREGPRISANLSTPLVGVWERINIGLFDLWVIAFAIKLLRLKNNLIHSRADLISEVKK
jgi:hypothetical protein